MNVAAVCRLLRVDPWGWCSDARYLGGIRLLYRLQLEIWELVYSGTGTMTINGIPLGYFDRLAVKAALERRGYRMMLESLAANNIAPGPLENAQGQEFSFLIGPTGVKDDTNN